MLCALLPTLVALAASQAVPAPRSGEQHVIARISPETEARLRYEEGDRVAMLKVRYAPDGLLDALRKQTGEHLESIERVTLEDDELSLLIWMRTAEVEPKLTLIPNPKTLLIAFKPRARWPRPTPAETAAQLIGRLVGHVSSLSELVVAPSLVPQPVPDDHPCRALAEVQGMVESFNERGSIDLQVATAVLKRKSLGSYCRGFVESLIGEHALAHGLRFRELEKWAYQFRVAPRWPAHLSPFQRAQLVAAELLTESGLYPEARVLLLELASWIEPDKAPYLILMRARIHARQGDAERAYSDLDKVIAQTPEKGADASWLYLAYFAKAALATHIGDSKRTLDTARAARDRRVETPPRIGAGLWLYGGEAALIAGDLDDARYFFERASKAGRPTEQKLALMRLGDLAILDAGNIWEPHRLPPVGWEAGPEELARLEAFRAAEKLRVVERTRAEKLRDQAVSRARGLYEQARKIEGAPRVASRLTLRHILLSGGNEIIERLRSLVDENTPTSRAEHLEAAWGIAHLYRERGDPDSALPWVYRLFELDETRGNEQRILELYDSLLSLTLRKRARHKDWKGLIAIADSLPPRLKEKLPLDAGRYIARARLELGFADRAVDTIFEVLGGSPFEAASSTGRRDVSEDSEAQRMLVLLTRAYVAQDDAFRADIVSRYFSQRYPNSVHGWRVHELWGRSLAERGRNEEALASLDAVANATPSGDPLARASLIRTHALSALGRVDEAAGTFTEVLDHGELPEREIDRAGLTVLSECAKSCTVEMLRVLIAAATRYEGGALLSERVRFLAGLRGVTAPEPETRTAREPVASVWRELLEIAPELGGPALADTSTRATKPETGE